MSIETLAAMERKGKGYKARREGFIPAVIYGKKVPSTSIQFDLADVNRYIRQSGKKGKVIVEFEGEQYNGIIKAMKTDPVTAAIQHIQIQVVDSDETVNFEVPFNFTGKSALETQKLFLNVDMPAIKVKGPVKLIPENVTVDVSEMQVGDVILVRDLSIVPGITVEVPEDYVVASVKGATIEVEEEPESEEQEDVATV